MTHSDLEDLPVTHRIIKKLHQRPKSLSVLLDDHNLLFYYFLFIKIYPHFTLQLPIAYLNTQIENEMTTIQTLKVLQLTLP